MKMNLKPSLSFQLWDMGKSCLGFIVTVALLVAFVPLITLMINGEMVGGSISGFGAIAAIFMFIIGIVAPRSYFRLDSQMGVSRATSFTALLVCVVLVALGLAVLGELLTVAMQALLRRLPEYTFFDLYQMIYREGAAMRFSDHLLSACLNASMCVCAYIGGMFFTLLFWRLNKLWSIVAAILLVIVMNAGVSVVAVPGLKWLGAAMTAFADAATKSPMPLIILFLVLSAVFAVIEWLLLRRAYIRASV